MAAFPVPRPFVEAQMAESRLFAALGHTWWPFPLLKQSAQLRYQGMAFKGSFML